MNAAVDIQKIIPVWQSLQTMIPLTHIDSEAEYERTTDLLNNLLDTVRDDECHPLYSLLTVVGDLIEAYERDHAPFAE